MNEAADFKSAVSTYFTTQASLKIKSLLTSMKQKSSLVGALFNSCWRRGPESNRASRICNPVHNRFVTAPFAKPIPTSTSGVSDPSPTKPFASSLSIKRQHFYTLLFSIGAGKEARTLDLNLGKVALYQLSYSRIAH